MRCKILYNTSLLPNVVSRYGEKLILPKGLSKTGCLNGGTIEQSEGLCHTIKYQVSSVSIVPIPVSISPAGGPKNALCPQQCYHSLGAFIRKMEHEPK